MKRKILTILGLSLLLFSVSSAGGYGETQTLPAWGKIKPTDIRSIIEQLPPGADHILIYVADGEEDAGVNQLYTPWEQPEPEEICIDIIPARIPKNSRKEIRRITEGTDSNYIRIEFR